LQNPNCYAGQLGDCSETTNGEHFISRSVLKVVGPTGMLRLSGGPWAAPTESAEVGFDAVEKPILCERHNRQLSPLDDAAAKLFRHVRDFAAQFAGNAPPGPSATLLNGHAIERWMLKVLIGSVYSQTATLNGQAFGGWSPPIRWLQTLVDGEAFAPPCGLYFEGAPLDEFSSEPEFSHMVLVANGGTIIGGQFAISGLRFSLFTEPIVEWRGDPGRFRLFALRFTDGREEKAILLAWPKDSASRDGKLTIHWKSSPGASTLAKAEDGLPVRPA
jgi:hypothetical protein